MIRITDVVEEIIYEDGFVIEAIQRGVLNISAYAKKIHNGVETKTFKPVKIGTIIVALNRISKKVSRTNSLTPFVKISTMSVTSLLAEISYEKTSHTLQRLNNLDNSLLKDKDFFTVIEGLNEITIICSTEVKDAICKHFSINPKVKIDNLVAVSVRFSSEYINIPNTIYSLVSQLANRHINVIEIVSTYTELTFIVYKNDMERTVQSLNHYSQLKNV